MALTNVKDILVALGGDKFITEKMFHYEDIEFVGIEVAKLKPINGALNLNLFSPEAREKLRIWKVRQESPLGRAMDGVKE